MNQIVKQRSKGFTLIELVIVVTVIAIISMIALPSYQKHVKKSRRTDAQGVLTELANTLERYYTSNNTYENATLGAGGIFPSEAPIDGNTKYYNLTIVSATANAYTLHATPKGSQTGNGRLFTDSTGDRQWNSKDDGSGTDKSW